MKKIVVIIIVLALLLSVMTACQKNGVEENPELSEIPVNVKSPAKMPELPDMNFEGLNFFEDGYEIVEFKGLSDGDTATFVVNKLPTATRFLAIDTLIVSAIIFWRLILHERRIVQVTILPAS